VLFYGNISGGDAGHLDGNDFGDEPSGRRNGTAIVYVCSGNGSDFQAKRSGAAGSNIDFVFPKEGDCFRKSQSFQCCEVLVNRFGRTFKIQTMIFNRSKFL